MNIDDHDAEYWTGLCTACGDEWQEDETPTICPECAFTGVVAMPPGSPRP